MGKKEALRAGSYFCIVKKNIAVWPVLYTITKRRSFTFLVYLVNNLAEQSSIFAKSE